MQMHNMYVLIKPDETPEDIIAEICDDANVGPNEHFAFSAILTPDKEPGHNILKINCIIPADENPYTPRDLIYSLYSKPEPANHVRYTQPSLDTWILVFRPLLTSIISRVAPRYANVFPDRDELWSILYLTITKLYNKGLYLHKTLIAKSFVNALNMEYRKLHLLAEIDSLDRPIIDDENKTITLLDQLVDPESTEWAKQSTTYTDTDYWQDMYETLRTEMLKSMSPLAFDRILIQLRTNTIDRNTSYQLDKLRERFNPGYAPRPNARGKNKGGKR